MEDVNTFLTFDKIINNYFPSEWTKDKTIFLKNGQETAQFFLKMEKGHLPLCDAGHTTNQCIAVCCLPTHQREQQVSVHHISPKDTYYNTTTGSTITNKVTFAQNSMLPSQSHNHCQPGMQSRPWENIDKLCTFVRVLLTAGL